MIRLWQALLLCGAGWLWSEATPAALSLVLETQHLNPAQQQASQQLLDEALRRLPPLMRQTLDRHISVHWKSGLPEAVYGRASQQRLELNRRLLPALTEGRAAQQATGRSHHTLHQELVATLIHELAHFYDRIFEPLPVLSMCEQQRQRLGPTARSEGCRTQQPRSFQLSDDPRFLDLAGWPQRSSQRGERERDNAHSDRTPDPYELDSPREFLAVNLEYFLLDPSYACRRPSLFAYFRTHFQWQPPEVQPCPPDYPVLNAGDDFGQNPLVRIDPKRLYAVDYLLAEANQEWVSRWGHSMLRLVICAPERSPGPECRLDLAHHLVLSFRAFVDDLQLSSWDGLVGDYPSRLFVLPLNQVVEEYTRMELRSLISVPLRLSAAQRQQLLAKAVEQHWSYDGRYYFFSNNCALESLKLLRSGTGHPALETLDDLTPTGLLEQLHARGVADGQALKDSAYALRWGYRFDSYRDRYQAMFQVLQQRLALLPAGTLDDWLALEPSARQPWIAQADLPAAAALLLLEQGAYYQQLLQAREALKQRYLSGGSNRSELGPADALLRDLLARSGYLSRPAELLQGQQGYGIPQPEEWQWLQQETQNRQAELERLGQQLEREIRQLLDQNSRSRLQATEDNLKHIGQHLRQLHQAKGGWSLGAGSSQPRASGATGSSSSSH